MLHVYVSQAQALQASSSGFAQGRMLSVPRSAATRCSVQRLVTYAAAAPTAERLRLNNLSPQEGSRRKEKRKGRGYGSGQVLFGRILPALVASCCWRMLPLGCAAGLRGADYAIPSVPQGGSCGFGMRGQKSRSGSGTRPGFEGGQTSLYRRLPKLKGIAGGESTPLQEPMCARWWLLPGSTPGVLPVTASVAAC